MGYALPGDLKNIENEASWDDRDNPKTLYGMLLRTVQNFPNHDAVSYQIFSGPKDKAETFSWKDLFDKTTQAANMFRGLGIQETDVVAYVLPNSNETLLSLLGGAIAGIVAPINPLLDVDQIAAILRETNAKVVVTLKAFPKTDVCQKTAEALALAPNVHTVLEVDLLRYLTPPKSWIVPLIRPKYKVQHSAKIIDFNQLLEEQRTTLDFEDIQKDRVAAYFHTGGTTGMPKVAQHKYSGLVYNGWLGARLIFSEEDNIICPLPLFHVFASHVIIMGAISSGAHVVFPTPQGYRGEGVFDNFWKLIERWKITFIITVPTAVSQLMQRPIDADVSTIKTAFSGSAPMPTELFRRFEEATGVEVIEGYGLTEATCLVSCNPPLGSKRIGSVGYQFPYTEVKIVKESREKLIQNDGMINLDPSWKKEKMFEEIEDIEKKIQTSALDHKAERKLLDRRKKLIEENDKWLKQRRDLNPEMVTYIDARREMNSLYRLADKSHRNMLDGVEKAQPQHEKQKKIRDELREIRRQLDRARELLSQSDKAVEHWERRLDKGFGELGDGFKDLLSAQRKVAEGGDSSFARKKTSSKKTKKSLNNKKKEEEE